MSLDLIVVLPDSYGFDSDVVFLHMLQRMFHLAPVVQLVTAKKLAILLLNVMFNRLGIPTNLISDRDL